jgi:hypothetical protein
MIILSSNPLFADEIEIIEGVKSNSIDRNSNLWLKKSDVTYLNINGGLIAENTKVYAAELNGNASIKKSVFASIEGSGVLKISNKSTVDTLSINGSVVIEDSVIKDISISGDLSVIRSRSNSIKAISQNIYLWDSKIKSLSVEHYDTQKSPLVIKCMGKSTVDSIALHSSFESEFPIIIVLDEESEKSFDKTKVRARQNIKYTKIYPLP